MGPSFAISFSGSEPEDPIAIRQLARRKKDSLSLQQRQLPAKRRTAALALEPTDRKIRSNPHPIARARIPYVVTRPFGILLVALYTLSWKSVTAVAFMAGTTSGT